MIYSSNHDSLTFFVERVFALAVDILCARGDAETHAQRRAAKKKFKFVHSAYNLVHCT